MAHAGIVERQCEHNPGVHQQSVFVERAKRIGGAKPRSDGGALTYSFTDNATRGLILGAWLAAWQAHNSDTANATALSQCPSTDKVLIGLPLRLHQEKRPLAQPRSNVAYDVAADRPTRYKRIYSNSGYRHASISDQWRVELRADQQCGQISNGSARHRHGRKFPVSALSRRPFRRRQRRGRTSGVQTGPPQFWQRFTTSNIDIGGDKFNSHYAT